MSIEISLLDPSDWQVYKTIRLQALQEDPQAFGSSYEKEVAFTDKEWQERPSNPDNSILIVKDNATPIGMIGYHLKEQGGNAHLWGMFVSKNYRGQGLGRQLINAVIKKAKELKNVKSISLDVNPEQTSAVQLYESLGFVNTGTRHYLMGDGKERELLTLELQGNYK